jgi:hypothetical protein
MLNLRRQSWPKRKTTNARIQDASARWQRAASIAGRIVKARAIAHQLLAIVDMRNVRSEKPWAQPADSKACRAWTALGGWDRYEVFFVIMVLREIGPVHW